MTTAYSIDLHPEVESDYNNAYAWYELQQVGLGERFLSAVHEKIVQICQQPEIYDYKSRKDFREAMVIGFPYLIVYKVFSKRKRILVTSIHHTSMDPNKKYRK